MEETVLSVVVPMYLESEVAEHCYDRLLNVMKNMGCSYEFIFVNDGSTDKTMDILRELAGKDKNVKVISFSRNFGHQAAVTAGIRMSRGNAVITMDADLQDPPELIPDMVRLWKQGYDVVFATRKKRKGETWFKLASAKLFYIFLSHMSSISIPRDTGDFRLLDRKAAQALNALPERNRYLRGLVSWIGFKQTSIEYERDKRFAGKTKYPLKKMLNLAANGIISFSFKPVKLIEKCGIVFILTGIILFIIFASGGFKNMPAAVFSSGSFFGGCGILCIGILGEYITRIFDETRERPLYIIEEKINF